MDLNLQFEHNYSAARAKIVHLKHQELQSVCDREKRLLDFEFHTSKACLEKQRLLFQKKAEGLYKKCQDMDIDPNTRPRFNLAIRLREKSLGRSRVMRESRAAGTATSLAMLGYERSSGPRTPGAGAAAASATRPYTSMENISSGSRHNSLTGKVPSFSSRSQSSLGQKVVPVRAHTSMADLVSSVAAARDAAAVNGDHGANDQEVVKPSPAFDPLQHPNLRKKKKELFDKPPPKKWLEARWKAIMTRNEKEHKKLVVLLDEFIKEIEEYKERFRRECDWRYLSANPDDVTQTILNRRMSVKMPLLLDGTNVTNKPHGDEKEDPHRVYYGSPNTKPAAHAHAKQLRRTRTTIPPKRQNAPPPRIEVTDTSGTAKGTPRDFSDTGFHMSTSLAVVNAPDHEASVESSSQQQQQRSKTPKPSAAAGADSLSLPRVNTPKPCATAGGGATAAGGGKQGMQARRAKSRLVQRKMPQNFEVPRGLPTVSSRKASLATNKNEQRFAILLDSSSESDSGESEGSDREESPEKSARSARSSVKKMSFKKTDLSVDTDMLMGAWQEFTQNQNLDNMKQLSALATKLKAKVTRQERSMKPMVGIQKALGTFKGILLEADTIK